MPSNLREMLVATLRRHILPAFAPFELQYAVNDNEEPPPEKRYN